MYLTRKIRECDALVYSILNHGVFAMAQMGYNSSNEAHHLCDFACTTTQASRLVLIVLPEADIRSIAPLNASAPSHDGVVQQLAAELEAMKATMKSDKEKHHREVKALKGKVSS